MTKLNLDELNAIIEGYQRPIKRAGPGMLGARTGIASLDMNLGGGLPNGLTEIYGEPSVGKTTLAGQIVAFNQLLGRQVAWVVADQVDVPYLKALGVQRKYLPLITTEEVEDFLSSFGRAIVVIDSLTSVRRGRDDWNEWVFDYLQHLQGVMRQGQVIVAVGHVRSRLSAHPGKAFAGGVESAHRNFTDLFTCRLELSRRDVGTEEYKLVVRIVANILQSPSRYLEVSVKKGCGINVIHDLVHTGVSVGVLEKRGSYLYFRGEPLGRGINSAGYTLSKCPEVMEQLLREVVSS